MIQQPKPWLGAIPWESIVTLNASLCQAQKMEPIRRPEQCELARKLWEAARSKPITLKDALQACHDAHRLTPFAFNNGNTFAAMAQTLVAELAKALPPLQAQMLRTTASHFVVGRVGHRELTQMLQYVSPMLGRSVPAPAPATTGAPASPASAPAAAPRSQLAVASSSQR